MNYSPRTWATGDLITAGELNSIEQAAAAAAVVADIPTAGTPTGDALRAAYGLSVAATASASATLVVGKFTPVDATSAARTMTLPTGGADGVTIGVEKLDTSTNTVTVTGNIRGVPATTISLVWQHETLLLRADSAGSWWPVAGHKTKASLDATYDSRRGGTATAATKAPHHDVRAYGALGNGSSSAAADTAAFQAAIAAATLDNAPIYAPRPPTAYQINTTLQTFKSMRVFGDAGQRSGDNGTEIRWAGTGALFQMGSDDGLAWDRNGYDGPQGLDLRDLYIKGFGAGGSLDNGLGVYGYNSYGVRDWRGGGVTMTRVMFESLDYWFWGVQSDLNVFDQVQARYCHSGFYLGPRSDQNTFRDFYPTLNDKVGTIDCARGTSFFSPKMVGNGTPATNPLTITNASTAATNGSVHEGTSLYAPWLESFQGTQTVEAFVEMGIGDTSTVRGLHVLDPVIFTNAQGSPPNTQYILKTDLADQISLEISTAARVSSLAGLVKHVGTSAPNGVIIHPFGYRANTVITTPIVNTSTGVFDPMMIARNGFEHRSRASSGAPLARYSRSTYTTAALEITVDGNLRYSPGSGSVDVVVQRLAAGVWGVAAGTYVLRTGAGTTANRPGPTTAGDGALYRDSTLGCLTYSDGTNWRRADTNAIV